MIDELNLIINTLNAVSVCGEDNMNRLLGSIQHLKQLREEIVKLEKEDTPNVLD